MLQQNVPLSQFSNFKIGGPARCFFEFKSLEELKSVLDEWRTQNGGELGNYFILGGGTNVLFRDEGFDGIVLKDSIKHLELGKDRVTASSGNLIGDLTDFYIDNSLSGFEWAGGLPGTVGGAIRGNAGAFGGETKDLILEVTSLDPATNEIKKRSNSDCAFAYRNSVYKSGDGRGEIILSAEFSYNVGDRDEIGRLTKEKEDYRKERHPLEYPNLGSVFKNVNWNDVPDKWKPEFEQFIKQDPFPVMPTAKLIAISELIGLKVGDAIVSNKHPNFIVNDGNATSQDVKQLIAKIKEEIKKRYDIELEEEVYCL